MNRAIMLRKLANEAADRVPLALEPKERAIVALLFYEAAGRIWDCLNAKERGSVAKQAFSLGTLLVLELVNPKTQKARSSERIAEVVLERLRPASRRSTAAPKSRRTIQRERKKRQETKREVVEHVL